MPPISKAKKLFILAQTGYRGEKENARHLLSKYVTKHNIRYSDLVGEETTQCYAIYRGRDWHEELLKTFRCQIVASIKGNIKMYKSLNMADTIVYPGTREEEDLIQRTLDHHTRELGKIIQTAFMNYIVDNNLHVDDKQQSIEVPLSLNRIEPINNVMLLHKMK